MRAQMSALLQAGLALKMNQFKRAVDAYIGDRAAQGQGLAVSYAIGAGLYAAAGIFLIAACLVAIIALFRWLEIKYGMFEAFVACGGLLLLLAAICAGIAASRLKRPVRQIPGLTARLDLAMKTNPVIPRQDQPKLRVAAAARQQRAQAARGPSADLLQRVTPETFRSKAGLAMVATLLGWALARRRSVARVKRSHRVHPVRAAGKANP